MALFEGTIHFKKDWIFSEDQLETFFTNDALEYSWMDLVEGDSIVLLGGSSSVKYSISSSELNRLDGQAKYINIAWNARGPIQTYFILKELDLSRVSHLYFGLDPWIYSKKYYTYRNKYMYLDFSLMESIAFNRNEDPSTFIKRYQSFVKAFTKKQKRKNNKANNEIPEDFGSETLHRAAKNFGDSIEDLFKVDKYGWSEIQFAYLTKIEQLCIQKNIDFTVFIPPKRKDYIQKYKSEWMAYHQSYKSKLANHISSPIFGKFDIFHYDTLAPNFIDNIHLNEMGQDAYTKVFYESTRENHMVNSTDYEWFEFDLRD